MNVALRRFAPAALALGVAVAGVAAVAPSAQAISEMNCNGSDYWRVYTDVSPGEACFAYNGYVQITIFAVYETSSGNNTGWQRMESASAGTWTSFFNYKDQWKQYNEGDDQVNAVNIN